MDILAGEKLSSIWVAIMNIIYWPVRSSSTKGGSLFWLTTSLT